MKLYLLIFSLIVFLSSCSNNKKENEAIHKGHDTVNHEHEDSSGVVVYWCPMDTQIVQNKPGTCTICEMDLEPKPMAHSHDSTMHKDWVYAPANVSVLSSVQSVKPVEKSVPIKIKVSGYITYDERRFNSISSKISGRIEKLYVKYNFQPVRKGQALFEIFSHDLQTAQEEYLFIKRNDPNASDLINSAKRKLLLLGMTDEQISKISSSDHVHTTTTVYSPYSGFVIEKQSQSQIFTQSESMGSNPGMGSTSTMNEDTKEITLREGAYLNKGETAFTIANTDVVWAVFEVYSNQLAQIKKNQTVHIILDNTDEMIMGKVDFIEPSYKGESGTSRFRVYLNNKDQNLKIGNLLSGEVDSGEKSGLWVPQSSVYDLGKDKIVFIKRDGAFESRKVTIGYLSEKEIEIVGGLSKGEEIAKNAQFLIDSESFIKVR